MTISSQDRLAGPYVGNDTTTAFPFYFKVFSSADLQVVRTDAAGVESTLALTTDYTVTLNSNQDSNPGGTVTLPAVLATGYRLTITSDIAPLQSADLTNQGGFYPKVITNSLDKLTILVQQVLNGLGRSLKFPLSDSGYSATLPTKAQRLGRLLAFHETTGDPVAGPDIAQGGTVIANVASIAAVAANIGDVNTCASNIASIIDAPNQAVAADADRVAAEAAAAAADADRIAAEAARTGAEAAQAAVYGDLASSAAGKGAELITYLPAGVGQVATSVQVKLRERISIKDFGAKGDDPAYDNYDAIKAACAAIVANGGGTLVIPEGRTYYVNRHRIDGGASANGVDNFAFIEIDGLVIEGCGSKIVMQGGWTRTADYTVGAWTYSYHNCVGFSFASCANVTIRDLEIDGGAATVTKVATAEGWSYGLVIAGCNGVVMENVYVHHYTADGLYLTSYGPSTNYVTTKNVTAINCKFLNNARQGCSIIQCRWATFINCEFSYSGQAGGYGGHSPSAGVDIEPNYYPGQGGGVNIDEFTGDITFIGGKFLDNSGFEFIATNYISTPHPVQFFGTTFKNTNNLNPQIVPGVKTCRFFSCNFDNVAWYPSYSLDNPTLSEFLHCTLTWSRDAKGIWMQYQNPTLKITSCRLNFTGTTPRTGLNYPIYLGASKAYLRDNDIFFSAALHGGTTYHAIAILQYLAESVGNRFSTDLSAAGKFFLLDYGSAPPKVDDSFASSGKFSPVNNVWGQDRFVAGESTFEKLISNYGTAIAYGTAAPTTGTWVRGSIVYNSAPAAGGVAGWVCVTGGTPGTWKAMANLAA